MSTDLKKTVLVFGLISGAISSLSFVAMVAFGHNIGIEQGTVIGYTTIVLSFLLVFFGVRSYRDNVGDGQITFVKGFAVGISITLISCVCYVVTWEIVYYKFIPDFWDIYGGHLVDKLKASGASPALIDARLQELRKYKELYKNPLINAALTFIEPFPIGLLVTLLSAAVLRKKPGTAVEERRFAASPAKENQGL
jgi:hypothetical protein